WQEKCRCVGGVEQLRPELQEMPFREVKVLQDGSVHIDGAGSTRGPLRRGSEQLNRIPVHVAYRPRRSPRGGIEISIDAVIAQQQRLTGDRVRHVEGVKNRRRQVEANVRGEAA